MVDNKISDSLDDLFEGATPDVRTAVNAPADYKPAEFVENCMKCGGSGYWRGRFKCFSCNGTGTKTFKTSFADRQKGRAYQAKHKAKVAASAWDDFKAREPEVAAWVERGGSSFQVDMKLAVMRYGDLTDNQLAACKRNVSRYNEAIAEAQARVAAAPTVEADKVREAFDNARNNGLKVRKLRIAGFLLSEAPAHSHNPDAIYVKTAGREYLGKIADGKFIKARWCSEENEQEVVKLLADPKGSAIAHGKMTGSCACCGRELTDPDSIDAGIGPICATKWGW